MTVRRPSPNGRPTRLLASLGNGSPGQALVEFALVLIPFLYLLLGLVDLGRGIYVSNAVAEAAREIARVTSVHPCSGTPCTLGTSPETAAVIATQKTMVPGLASPAAQVAITCTDITDQTLSSTPCAPGNFVRVSVSVPFQVITPFLPVPANFSLGSVAHIQIP
jgi:Flp pilus assembly protein TadG